MSIKLGVVITTALSFSFLSQSVNAASSATVNIGPINVTLIDLNPSDGILPSITWNNSGTDFRTNVVSVLAYDTANSVFVGNADWGKSFGDTNIQNIATSVSGATGSVISGSDDTKLDGVTLNLDGYANGTFLAGNYSSYSAYAYLPERLTDLFTLGAYTGVIFSADSTISATTTIGWQDGLTYTFEYATASASFSVSGTQPAGSGGNQSSFADIDATVSYLANPVWNDQTQTFDYTYSGQSLTKTAVLGGSFMNFTNVAKEGMLQFSARIDGYSYVVNSVPEPDAYALMFAGLSLVMFVRRRRN